MSYRKGRRSEKELRDILHKRGWDATVSDASRGEADIVAVKRKYGGLVKDIRLIQVKSTGGDRVQIDRQKMRELKDRADATGATSDLAVKYGDKWRVYYGIRAVREGPKTRLLNVKKGKKPEHVY